MLPCVAGILASGLVLALFTALIAERGEHPPEH